MHPLSFGPLIYLGVGLVVAFGYNYYKKSKTNPHRLPLPPGPEPLPVIGNALDLPADRQWLAWDNWSKQYGDIVYATILGQPIIALGSRKRASDLLEKRSANYSSRGRLPMLYLAGWNFTFSFTPYDEYKWIQTKETRALLRRLLSTPENFLHHIRHTFAATIMYISYGIQVSDENDEYITLAEKALSTLAEAGVPGAFLVDAFPILRYIPAWFPGATFQRKAAQWRVTVEEFVNRPYDAVKEAMRAGVATPSMTTTLIENLPNDGSRADEEKIAKNCAAVAYAGGADTTVSTVQCFFLAMAMYPEVQKRAQAELDSVVGQQRLPDFTDRDCLPYINALVKEITRWQPVTPLGFPHCSTEDDEYDGWFIPAGTIIIGNAWTMMHDPDIYPEPEEFKPERFLKDGKLNTDVGDPSNVVFGFGRRICSGRHLSDNALYIIVSSVLSVYNIESTRDAHGNVIKLVPEMTPGLLSYPVPFECTIKPRSAAAEALIRDSEMVDSL